MRDKNIKTTFLLANNHLCHPLNQNFKLRNSMRHVTVYTTDEEYNHFIELAKNLHYVKKIETDAEAAKKYTLDNIKVGLAEVGQFKKGKLKTTPAKDFLNEL